PRTSRFFFRGSGSRPDAPQPGIGRPGAKSTKTYLADRFRGPPLAPRPKTVAYSPGGATMSNLWKRKSLDSLVSEAGDEGHALKKTLGPLNLITLGIGAIIGAGIFSLTGTAAAYYAGPGIVYSFVIGGILCALAGLCYAEMAAMIPVAGSAYAYSY